MEFKKAFDNLTKEENVLLPDEEGMSKEELVEEFKNRQQYIDEAIAQVHHLTSFRPATKSRLVARGNKAKNILRQEISKLENEMKAPKKKKKKVKYDKEGKLTPEEISFILSPESSFDVDPDSLQRGGKRKTRRKRKTKKRRHKTRRKTRKKRKRKTRKKRGRGKVDKKTKEKMAKAKAKVIPTIRKIKKPISGAKANLVLRKVPFRRQSALRMFESRINQPVAASTFDMSDIQRALPQQQTLLTIPSSDSDSSGIASDEIREIMNTNEQGASKE